MFGIVEVGRDLFASSGVTGEDAIAAKLTCASLDVKLQFMRRKHMI
jgi:hypothetical protein